MKTAISVINECRVPALGVRVSAFAFWQRLLLINIGSRILYEKYDLSNVKIFRKNSLFHPEMILRPLFCFKDAKAYRLINI